MHLHSALADHSSPRGSALPNIEHEAPALTPTQIKVLRGVHSGLLNKQIGAELHISEITVKAHRGNVMRKMRANSLADLVKMATTLRIPAPPASTSPE